MRERDRVEMQEEGQRGEGGEKRSQTRRRVFRAPPCQEERLSGRGEGVLRVFV